MGKGAGVLSRRGAGGDHNGIERVLAFPRGLVEIRSYDWAQQNIGMERIRPNMYVFELVLSPTPKQPQKMLSGPVAHFPIAQPGRVRVMSPGRQVPLNVAQGLRRSLLCLLDPSCIDELLPRGVHRNEAEERAVLHSGHPSFEWLLRNIYREARHDDLGSAIMVESFANALAVQLVRRLTAPRPELVARQGGLGPWRMRALKERIYGSQAMPRLAELAEISSMTVRHLCRAFKAETGRTVGEAIEAAMAERARGLLSETNISLAQIAGCLGFATSSSFSNAFHRATGLKPREIERPAKTA